MTTQSPQEHPAVMSYEAWRISYQSSEAAARAAYLLYTTLLQQRAPQLMSPNHIADGNKLVEQPSTIIQACSVASIINVLDRAAKVIGLSDLNLAGDIEDTIHFLQTQSMCDEHPLMPEGEAVKKCLDPDSAEDLIATLGVIGTSHHRINSDQGMNLRHYIEDLRAGRISNV